MKRVKIVVVLAFLPATQLHAQSCPRVQQRGDTLFADPRDAESYRWYKNGAPMPGQTANFVVMDENAEYSVEVFATSTTYVYSTADTCAEPVCWSWIAIAPTSTPDNMALAVCAHMDGSVTVAGSFSGPLILGNDTLSGSMPSYDMFLARYDAEGNVLWARGVLGSSFHEVYPGDVTAHSDGSVTVTGRFGGTVDFGGNLLTSVGGPDIFVARYDAAGNLLWARRAGNSHPLDEECGYGAAAHADGSVTVVGTFVDTADFGGVQLVSPGALVGSPTRGIFVARYNAAGNIQWAQRAGSKGEHNIAYDVVSHPDGGITFAGVFGGDTLYFGEDLVPLIYPAPGYAVSGTRNGLLARYDSLGNLLRAKRVAETNLDEFCYGLAAHAYDYDSVTVVGSFVGRAKFGEGMELDNDGEDDAFVARYNTINPTGAAKWARRVGGLGLTAAYGVAAHPDGSVFVTGEFLDTARFDGVELVNRGVGGDMFIARYNVAGKFQWAQRAGGDGSDVGKAVATHPDGAVTVVGWLSGTVDFGDRTIVATANPAIKALFVARLRP